MIRKENMRAIILMVTIMIFSIIGSTLYISCKPIPTTPRTYTPPAGKLIPAYTLKINYPSKVGFVTVEKGGSVTLTVTIRSLVDEPIEIRLTFAAGKVPAFVEYEVPEGYITLNPRDTIDTQITIKVSENAQPASYKIGITGELKEPVKERGGEGIMFSLTVIDRQS